MTSDENPVHTKKKRGRKKGSAPTPSAWKPGQSGNVRGLGTLSDDLATEIRRIGSELIETESTEDVERLRAFIRSLYARATDGDNAAADILLTRGWGRVRETISIDLQTRFAALIVKGKISREQLESTLPPRISSAILDGLGMGAVESASVGGAVGTEPADSNREDRPG